MSLLALGALLEGRHDYRIIDGNLVEDGLAALRQAIGETAADILAVTVMPGPQLSEAVSICRTLRGEFPALTIVWGGYFPTLHPEVVADAACVDFAFRGHCEHGFVELVGRLRAGASCADIEGLVFTDRQSGERVVNARAPVPRLAGLPDFPYHRVDMRRYVRATYLGSRTLSHHASYGCPFQCNFCGVVNMVGGRYSARSAEHSARVVRALVEDYGANAVEFFDSNYFVKESRVAEFSERIHALGIAWWGEGRIDTLLAFSDSTLAKMSASGLKMVYMGAETGSDLTLDAMNKGGRLTTEQTLALAARFREFGIVPEMSFMLGNPPEPERDVAQTIEFIRKVKRVNPATEIILYLYSPVPLDGSLYDAASSTGFRFPDTLEEWADARWIEFAQHRTSALPWLDEGLKRRVKNFQRVLHAAYPTVTDQRFRGLRRTLLSYAGRWRYALAWYDHPWELRALNRLIRYQRPETAGF